MPEAVVGSDVFSAEKADAEKLPQACSAASGPTALACDLYVAGAQACNFFHTTFNGGADAVVSTFTRLAGDEYDQSAVDGKGHLFVASNNGNIVGIDYDSTGLIGTGTLAEKFLATVSTTSHRCRGSEGCQRPSLRPWRCSPRVSSASAYSGAVGTECKENRHLRETGRRLRAPSVFSPPPCSTSRVQLRHSRVRGSTGFSNGRPSARARRYSRFRR